MIFDRIDNLEKYRGIHGNLDTAIAFVLRTDLSSLPVGKTEVDGERVFIEVSDVSPKEAAQGSYEYHRQYMDLQIGIRGRERLFLGGEVTEQVQAYRRDIGLAKCRAVAECVLDEGRFVLFRAGEYHMPGIKVDGSAVGMGRKAVVKVAEQVDL